MLPSSAHPWARSLRLLIAFGLALALLGGCRKIKNKLGMAEEITAPQPGSYEALVQDVLRAALISDAQKSWEAMIQLLHSNERGVPGSVSACKSTFWPAFRRKVKYLVKDPTIPSFEIVEDRAGEREGSRRVFIKSRASDMPTPIPVKRDPNQKNDWKLAQCSI